MSKTKNKNIKKIKLSDIMRDFEAFEQYKDEIWDLIKKGEIEVDEPLLLLVLKAYL